jgi:DNA-binding MarR family transcriptional regulator
VKDLSIAEYRALAEFRYQIRTFVHFSEEQARAHGLEPQQHQLLLAIKGLPAGKRPTVGELAARLRLKHHSTVELVDRLAANGSVVRRPGKEDKREVIVSLTPSGAALLRKLTLAHRQELDKTGPQLARSLRAARRGNRKEKMQAA